MRRGVWIWCIWSSISVFTQTDIFPYTESDEDRQNSQLQQVVDLYVAQMAEAEENL